VGAVLIGLFFLGFLAVSTKGINHRGHEGSQRKAHSYRLGILLTSLRRILHDYRFTDAWI
jgi:hypothetical protein